MPYTATVAPDSAVMASVGVESLVPPSLAIEATGFTGARLSVTLVMAGAVGSAVSITRSALLVPKQVLPAASVTVATT